jgi:anti-sigma factor RsiW
MPPRQLSSTDGFEGEEMKEDPFAALRDAVLARELTAEEERRVAEWLKRHPERAEDWQRDLALGRAMRDLPDVPVPSNFTSIVLGKLRRDLPRRSGRFSGWRLRWLPRTCAGVSLAVLLAIFGGIVAGWTVHNQRRQAQYVRHVAALRVIADLPPEALRDFEAIRCFGETVPAIDYELLSALQ